MNGHLYRLREINEIETEIHTEKLKHENVAQKYHWELIYAMVVFLPFSFV